MEIKELKQKHFKKRAEKNIKNKNFTHQFNAKIFSFLISDYSTSY